VGLIGRITVPIAIDGLGEVSCSCKAQTTRRMARSRATQPIPEGAMVRVVEVQGDVVVVEPVR
jgi:membrane-bound ClpP family serine protease